ncbi:MAG: tRNA dihydrouridine synthase DusB [Bdellovibrionales bacterium RIFOXYC1_FULL_54_43]|nr:MAG: tRNA dihydrouridine synthase DusB [Bdellovibrionales bacterium RIFOXYC1_FULL_54_43]OFZ82198.1 MAG: tRNA dihydrouridine synthase DusB [Bdellovibrionales bacterium RIFOXYD1_FULL_55_31]
MKLGPFEIAHPFLLAPMAGITDSPFRRLMKRHGCALVCSELVSANGLFYGGEKTRSLLRFHEEERPIGLQIFGEDAERLAQAARTIESLGADFVDLNLGCPVPKVVKKGGGSAMCRDLVSLGHTLVKVVRAVNIPVTIKIRSGWDASSRNALEVTRVAAASGVTWVALHARTRAQGYSGTADWDLIGEVKARSSIPVIGNGDITTPELGVLKMKQYGVDAVMIGRAALRNPFIFEQSRALWFGEEVKRPAPEHYLRLIDELNRLFMEFYPSRTALLQARKFLAWFSSGFSGCHEFRKKVFTIPEPDVLWEEARRFFAENTAVRDERTQADGFLMGGHG